MREVVAIGKSTNVRSLDDASSDDGMAVSPLRSPALPLGSPALPPRAPFAVGSELGGTDAGTGRKDGLRRTKGRRSELAQPTDSDASRGARRERSAASPYSIGLSLLARHLPAWTARFATRRFLTPPAPRPIAPAAREIFARAADQFFVDAEVPWGGHREPTRARLTLWGRGPAIYLLHGWGGRASQFASLVEPLAAAGFTVVTLDAPGHGDVPARNTSVLHFAVALRAAVESFGPARCVVGHSLGGAAVAYALREGLAADGVVLIGTPHTPGSTFGYFLTRIGVDARLHQRITDEAERQFGFRFGDLVVRAPADRPPLPALLVHDRDDREFGYDNASQIARDWPSARVIETSGLGHYRILRDKAVAEGILAFARMPSAFTAG